MYWIYIWKVTLLQAEIFTNLVTNYKPEKIFCTASILKYLTSLWNILIIPGVFPSLNLFAIINTHANIPNTKVKLRLNIPFITIYSNCCNVKFWRDVLQTVNIYRERMKRTTPFRLKVQKIIKCCWPYLIRFLKTFFV